jgi:hypothetical protein
MNAMMKPKPKVTLTNQQIAGRISLIGSCMSGLEGRKGGGEVGASLGSLRGPAAVHDEQLAGDKRRCV